MKKKGFTLVELLAVIAILAILVIIALPNVMGLFNEAKKNSFANELKEIYKTAQNQWMTDSMINTAQMSYGRYTSTLTCITKGLELSGRTQLSYGITIDKAGNVIDFVATDNTYYYDFNGTSTAPLKIEGIDNGQGSVIRLADSGKTSAQIKCATDSAKNVFEITPA
jgi:prepilin-type N-terminal cleavage/methylation domain-containing protein